MNTTWLGFLGASLAAVAYLPQIWHLARERCAAGVSAVAFAVWLLASALMLAHAIAIGAVVFVTLSAFQIAATGVILAFALRLRGARCAFHSTADQLRARGTVKTWLRVG